MNTAVEVMTALASHDAQFVVEGDRVRLLFSASHRPPEALIEAARFHKQSAAPDFGKPPGNSSRLGPVWPCAHSPALQSKCPALVEPDRWQQAVKDAE